MLGPAFHSDRLEYCVTKPEVEKKSNMTAHKLQMQVTPLPDKKAGKT